MLVYGFLPVGGMVFLGYGSGFQPNLTFFQIVMVSWDCFLGFELLNYQMVSESGVEVVSRKFSKA